MNREEWFKITIINTTDNISDVKNYFREHHLHIENTVNSLLNRYKEKHKNENEIKRWKSESLDIKL